MNTLREAFSSNLKKIRGSRTQAAFAEVLGLPVRTYQKIEAGNVPQKATLGRITSKLGVSEVSLFQIPNESESAALLRQLLNLLARLDDDGLEAMIALARRLASRSDPQ